MPASEASDSCFPRQFFCPITQEVMVDPVVCSDGFSYERSAIVDWLRLNNTSPMTRQPIARHLHPNGALRQMIAEQCDSGATVVPSETRATYVAPDGTETAAAAAEGNPGRVVKAARRLRGAVDLAARVRWRFGVVWWLFLRRCLPVNTRQQVCKVTGIAMLRCRTIARQLLHQVLFSTGLKRISSFFQLVLCSINIRQDATARRLVVEGPGISSAQFLLAFLALR